MIDGYVEIRSVDLKIRKHDKTKQKTIYVYYIDGRVVVSKLIVLSLCLFLRTTKSKFRPQSRFLKLIGV